MNKLFLLTHFSFQITKILSFKTLLPGHHQFHTVEILDRVYNTVCLKVIWDRPLSYRECGCWRFSVHLEVIKVAVWPPPWGFLTVFSTTAVSFTHGVGLWPSTETPAWPSCQHSSTHTQNNTRDPKQQKGYENRRYNSNCNREKCYKNQSWHTWQFIFTYKWMKQGWKRNTHLSLVGRVPKSASTPADCKESEREIKEEMKRVT